MGERLRKNRIQWHPAFCFAVQLVFREETISLNYQKEYMLNTKPLQADLLIIKKPDKLLRYFAEQGFQVTKEYAGIYYVLKEGMEKGMEAGEERMAKLFSLLYEAERGADVKRALSDLSYRKLLFEEFEL